MNEYTQRTVGNLPQGSLEEALEKTAAIQIIQSIAAERGVDLSGYDLENQTVEQLHAAINEATDTEKTASAEVDEAEIMQKMAEAQVIGEGMAVAFYNKSAELQKTAASQAELPADGAFETLARLRAQAWVDEHQKTASAETQPTFDDYVNARAAELLRGAGWQV